MMKGWRIVPSQDAGYAPGLHVLQRYDDKIKVWFDVGDPKSREAAEAAYVAAESRVKGPQ